MVYINLCIKFLISDRGNLAYVVQSFFLPANSQLTFTTSGTLSVQPNYNDDNIGVEDPESLELVIQAVPNSPRIVIDPAVANVNILDDEGMKIISEQNISPKWYIIYKCLSIFTALYHPVLQLSLYKLILR